MNHTVLITKVHNKSRSLHHTRLLLPKPSNLKPYNLKTFISFFTSFTFKTFATKKKKNSISPSMTSTILRRSSSIFSRRFFVAAVEQLPIRHRSLALLSSAVNSKVGERLFHAKSGPLNFHSSLVSRGAQLAVDYDHAEHDDGCGVNGDEGLEIAKLGISKEIVNALGKKGIAKLFPIQVWFNFEFQLKIIIIIIKYIFFLM